MGDMVRFPNAGCLVEYMEGNVPQIAMVTEEQSGRLRLLLPNRRETRLNASRLLPGMPSLCAGLGVMPPLLLEEHRTRRETLCAAIDPFRLVGLAQVS